MSEFATENAADSLHEDQQHKCAKERLGVLFVHGIGEQAKGETLLGFGDPIIVWLERWLQSRGERLVVERVDVDDDAPAFALIAKEDSPEKILMKESWWANKFRPPSIYELAWWLLLVGTWATFSHASKPLKENLRRRKIPAFVVALFRAILFYTPLALTFQIVVFALTLLGSLPLLPWRDFFAGLLLKLSKTLGDSFVLIHSPMQQRMALDTVTKDVELMLEKCKRVLIVAHSQGAAITYNALRRWGSLTDADTSRLAYVSVGSGLDKLEELKDLSATLEFRGEQDSVLYRRMLYLSPVVFLLFWGVVLYGAVQEWPLSDIVLWATLVILILWTLSITSSRKRKVFEFDICDWTDIYASSDPVSNGEIGGPTNSVPIVNERSLLTDHTSYFANNIDFIPRLAKIMADLGSISWIGDVKLPTVPRGMINRLFARPMRKRLLMIGKWTNRLGLLYYAITSHGGLDQLAKVIGNTLVWLSKPIFGGATRDVANLDLQPYYWVYGVLLYGAVDIFLRWSDRTAERTETSLFFCDDWFLRRICVLLTCLLVVGPIGAWIWMVLQ